MDNLTYLRACATNEPSEHDADQLMDAAAEITRLRADVERLQQRCADWAASYGEKSSDLEDLKRQNAELADARIFDGFARYDAVEAARAEVFERAAQIAEARLPLYTQIAAINAVRECVSSIRQAASGESGT